MPSMPANTAVPGVGLSLEPMKSREGFDLPEAAIGHFEYADLIGRSEAVLHGSQDAELVPAVALEIEHGIDHVLDDLGAGDLPILRDVTDEKDCR